MNESTVPQATAFALLTPEDWYRIPLRSQEQRTASVRALVDRQFHGLDDQPILRRETEGVLLGVAEAGAESNGVALYLSTQEVLGVPLAASLLVTVVAERFDALQAVGALAVEGDGEVALVELPSAGRSARRRRTTESREGRRLGSSLPETVVEYFVPVPGRDEVLLLTFSTPLEPIAEALTALFDSVAATLRWPSRRPAPM